MKKILKWVAIVVAVIVAVPLIAAAFMSKTMSVRQEIVIDRPGMVVYDYVRNLRHQPEFSTWAQLDPNMTTEYRGVDGEIGSVYAWNSDDEGVGVGEMEIKELDPGKRIAMELRFTSPMQSSDPTEITLESMGENRTRLVQTYEGKMAYPLNLLIPMVEATVNDGMSGTLANLKNILEEQPAAETPEEAPPESSEESGA
jgi:uncharacterized protein YndB with AHSA1/START domain